MQTHETHTKDFNVQVSVLLLQMLYNTDKLNHSSYIKVKKQIEQRRVYIGQPSVQTKTTEYQ